LAADGKPEAPLSIAQWAARSIGGAFMGPAGVEAADNPGSTLASAAVPMVAGKVVSVAAPVIKAGAAKVLPYAGNMAGRLVLRSLGINPRIIDGAVALLKQRGSAAAAEAVEVGPGVTTSQVGRVAPPSLRTTPRATASATPPQSPPAAPSVAPPAVAPAAEPVAPAPAKAAMSPAMVRNQVGLAARRANATFTEAQLDAADALVGQGLTPVQAVMKIKEAGRSVNAAAKLAEMLQGKGALSVEQMNAEIASRVGNRSPVR
jgi:hypothetical protein